MKVGLSLGDYYEGARRRRAVRLLQHRRDRDVPFTSAPTRFGTWNVHGGVEYQRLGDRNSVCATAKNQAIGSIGIGFSY